MPPYAGMMPPTGHAMPNYVMPPFGPGFAYMGSAGDLLVPGYGMSSMYGYGMTVSADKGS